MVFCKRCHKRVIKVIATNMEFRIECTCDNIVWVRKGSELMGNIKGYLSSEKRSGYKRCKAKEMRS